jgi:ADP-ribose pyrophosphatase
VPILVEAGRPNRLVVIREYRVTLQEYEYTFPAGLVEPGEPIEDTVRRELREETGLEVLEITRISPPTFSSSGLSDETAGVAFVKARALPGGVPILQDSEIIEVLYLDYEQVCKLCDQREPINGRTWCILEMYRQLGAIR